MAPEAANQKRKRGRPPANAAQDNAGASQTQLKLTNRGTIDRSQTSTHDGDADEDSRPRKRGRPAKADIAQDQQSPATEAVPPAAEQPPNKRRRGRQPSSQQTDKAPEQETPVEPVEADPPAEEQPPNKRRRGRQPSSQQTGRAPEQENPVEPAAEATAEAASKGRKKRGARSSQQEADEDGVESPAAAPKKLPKKAGRPPTRTQEVANDNEEPTAAATNKQTKKRGRPPRVSLEAQPEEPKQAKRRGRALKEAQASKKNEVAAEEADDENEGNSSLLRRSGRQRRSPSEQQHAKEQRVTKADAAAGKDADAGPAKAKQRGRPSNGDKPTREAQEAGQGEPTKRKARGRPSLSQDAPEKRGDEQDKRRRTASEKESEPTGKKRGPRKKAPEQPAEDEAEDGDGEENEPAPKEASRKKGRGRTSDQPSKSRRREGQDEQASRSPSPKPAPYRQLTTRTRRIPRHVIENKWSPLDAASVDNVANLLHSASRPVLLQLNNARKHAQATAALNAISNRLRAKLSRGLPFPPATTAHRREDELEFERTVDGIHALEAQLDPLLHSVALLEKEKKRAERELGREYKILNTLSANARSAARGRRDQLRKTHVLVPPPPNKEEEDVHHMADDEDELLGELRPVDRSAGKTFAGLENDGELKDLAGQLANHMESMRGNLQQIEGIAPAIAETRAVLKLALLPRLDQESLDRVMLG